MHQLWYSWKNCLLAYEDMIELNLILKEVPMKYRFHQAYAAKPGWGLRTTTVKRVSAESCRPDPCTSVPIHSMICIHFRIGASFLATSLHYVMHIHLCLSCIPLYTLLYCLWLVHHNYRVYSTFLTLYYIPVHISVQHSSFEFRFFKGISRNKK